MTNSPTVAVWSNTILGRFIAVLIILLYSSADKFVGLFVCLLVILFYQTDYVEGMSGRMFSNDLKKETLVNLEPSKIEPQVYGVDITDKKSDLEYEQIKTSFRKQYCDNGALKFKNMSVSNDMAQHVFPNVKFNDYPCNLCSTSCDFSIIESRINAEANMIPTNTRP